MSNCFLDLTDTLGTLRTASRGCSLSEFFLENSLESVRTAVDSFVKSTAKQCSPCLGYTLSSVLASRITPLKINDFAQLLVTYCDNRIGDRFSTFPFLFETLLHLFPSPDIPIRIEKDIALMANASFLDRDGLLTGPNFEFCKEGILTESNWFLYHNSVPGSFVTGAFIDELTKVYNSVGTSRGTLAIKVNQNVIISRRMHFDSFTKAYIRGPIGLSVDILNSPAFPEDPSGTVTEHRRTESNPLLDMFPLDRIEVMWSRRNELKSVQIESLVPEPKVQVNEVQTMYVHSQWSPSASRIIHCDGAIKAYSVSAYSRRLATDIKKSMSKSEKYMKVFRLDLPLELKTWCQIVSKYFNPNELIIEYFGGSEP